MISDRLPQNLLDKYHWLQQKLVEYGHVAVAYSGGVDSTLLLVVARVLLGDNVLGLIADSPSLPRRELREATEIARKHNLPYVVLPTHEVEQEDYLRNPVNRCYFCKRELFTEFLDYARSHGFPYLLEGTNADDAMDFRPGLQAIQELKVVSPLKEVGLHKQEIRQLAQALGLENWDKPAQACLASRFPPGTRITLKALRQVEAAEDFLLQIGFRVVRVRYHGKLARIEVGEEEISRLLRKNVRRVVTTHLRKLGFEQITVDLQGYRSGGRNVSPVSRKEARHA